MSDTIYCCPFCGSDDVKTSLCVIKKEVNEIREMDNIYGDLWENFYELDKTTQIAERLLDEFINPDLNEV